MTAAPTPEGFRFVSSVDESWAFELLRRVYNEPKAHFMGGQWTKRLVRSELEKGEVLGFACQSSRDLASVLFFRKQPDCNEITLLATDPRFRGLGLMSSLLQTLQQASVEASQPIHLEVHESNSPALDFYMQRGFVEVGRRAKYYSDGGASILLNWSKIN